MSQKTVRTFVAIPTTPAVQSAAGGLIEGFRAVAAGVKWVEPCNLHLTVKFLGDVDLTETARICQAVGRAAAEVEPFEIDIAGAGAFPNVARPRTIWLAARDDGQLLRALHREIETRLEKLGFRRDSRMFQAHLTMGRVGRAGTDLTSLAQALHERADFAVGRMRVRELIVFSSRLAPSGPTYEPLGAAPLG